MVREYGRQPLETSEMGVMQGEMGPRVGYSLQRDSHSLREEERPEQRRSLHRLRPEGWNRETSLDC